MKRNPADQHETTIWRNQTNTVTWLAVSVSLPTLLGYQRASAFVNATKLASQPLFSSDEEYKISNVLSNTFFIDIDHVSIAIHIVIVLSPSPSSASCLLSLQVIGFIYGFSIQQFGWTVYIMLAGFTISCLLTLPPWPVYRQNPLNWQPAVPETSGENREKPQESQKKKKHKWCSGEI